jgi:predicted nucleic acid-binding protein
VSDLLVDTSVLLKWFHSEGESEVHAARSLRLAHCEELITVHILDLAVYELGNVLVRSLRWASPDVADQLADLLTICGPPIALDPVWLPDTAALAGEHRLTLYDAGWAAAARARGMPLVSADAQLLAAGLARTASSAARELALPGAV